ncbi:MAG: ATP-binding cassette domain-containing protein [Sulfuritalea sp.]|jgi:ABC-type branched-subunit amino acid transport system ATPase component|nr:ATP-binding cassette domain-containing protein [Sulfuritalea sp.]
MIAIRDVSVSFGGVLALNNLTVNLADSVVGIIGPNGAGKTTLLNVFSGFVTPACGSIRAFDTDLLAMRPHQRARWGLRRSFQTEQVVDDLSVADNVRAMLDSLPVTSRSERERQIEKALTYVQLEGKADELGSALNTYQRRMVELAKTLVGSPRIVLLDEPGAGLREEEVDALRQTILGIGEQFGAMTLLIDHDVEMIAATCISTVVLDFGELLAFGPTAEILKDDRVKAAYLGIEEAE